MSVRLACHPFLVGAALGLMGSLVGCGGGQVAETATLVEARQGFQTSLRPSAAVREPVPQPPPGVFDKVAYHSPVGKLAAYVSPDPGDGKKHPAIIWITGGDCNSIGDIWSAMPRDNDQSAGAFRRAGIVMMFPSLRGGNDNPGVKEGFLGEIYDVLAAADFLEKQSYVDPDRVYLGGHSTGGTLVLLVAEWSDRFRAVFSFGPAADVAGYPPDFLPFDTSNRRELKLRSPGYWLASIKTPVFVIEGTVDGNMDSLRAMARASTNPHVRFLAVQRASHFSVLAPACELIAGKILADHGAAGSLSLTDAELNQAFAR
jgi:dienelactone hydrolase